jgi:hypothetical protein
MHRSRLTPPLGFHLASFTGALLTGSYVILAAWLVATIWLLGLGIASAGRAHKENCQSRHPKGKC